MGIIMIRKKIMISGFLCLLCGTMLVSCKPARQGEKSSDAFTASMVADVRPIEEIKVSAKMDESSQVRISWNQVSRAASYVVCRSDNDGSEWKKLKELTPDKTSYVKWQKQLKKRQQNVVSRKTLNTDRHISSLLLTIQLLH